MTNIPTELMRTLITVVDLRSFTKAAQSLGVTQPAVSAQIKRLQNMLGSELFDKSAPGVTLSETGQAVVSNARRLLAINDRILHLAAPRASAPPLRIGIQGDFGGTLLPTALAQFRRGSPHQGFHVRSEGSDLLMRGLRQRELDLAVAFTHSGPPIEARHRWTEAAVWIRSPATAWDPAGPVPLVTHGEGCLVSMLAIQALDQAGREWEEVFNATSSISIAAAVAAGLGISATVKRYVLAGLEPWSNAPLPPLPDVECGIYLREGRDRRLLEQLADAIADVIRPPTATAALVGSAIKRIAG
jgi:DNA-binding transcriptional LysR family regulator